MSRRIRVGVFLPTFHGPERRSGAEIAEFARRAEELGFDSLWATDHLLHGSQFYRTPWLEPLTTLTYAAAATTRVDLGTSVLVMPVRQPVVLAKQLSTLQALSGDRFILGAGTGWDAREFDAVGITKSSRGVRTDECIAIVRSLLSGAELSCQGEYHSLDKIEIGPAMPHPLRVWAAGGRQLAHASSPERPAMSPRVLRRIGASDGWIARPTSTPDQIREDLHDIGEWFRGVGRDLSTLTLVHENFLHFVPTDDPRVARREQRKRFLSVMGEGRPFEYFEQVYLTGTADEVRAKIDARLGAGIEHLILHTLEPGLTQLELWAEHLLPRIRARSADEPSLLETTQHGTAV